MTDPLAPARGCLVGMLLALPLWAAIGYVVVKALGR